MPISRFSCVLFDCDGVLVDSEPITNSILREMLQEIGWDISVEECIRRFVGRAFKDEWKVIFEHTGIRIDDDWVLGFRARRDAALRERLKPVPGAVDAVQTIAASLPVACVSGADRGKIEMQLGIAGLTEVFGKNVFSGMEMARSKPAPDVYLAAAASLGVDPATAVVIEDSGPGVAAGLAAGSTVFGFAPAGPTNLSAETLFDLGVSEAFATMADLPTLVLTDSLDLTDSPDTVG